MALYTLYTFEYSVWGAIAALAASETGYNDEEVESKSVNVPQGENLKPEYLALNPAGTVPTLQAKDGTLHTNTKACVAELIKHGRIKLDAGSAGIIEAMHNPKYDPNVSLLSARNDEELEAKATSLPGIYAAGRQAALEKYSTGPGAEAYKAFYERELVEAANIIGRPTNIGLLALYQGKATAEVTERFFTQSKAHFDTVSNGLYEVFPDLISSDGLPENGPTVSDLFFGAWLARISVTVGGKTTEDGLKALETAFGKPLPQKIVTYWNSWGARESWKKVYGAIGLH